jgi:hypothetical protein
MRDHNDEFLTIFLISSRQMGRPLKVTAMSCENVESIDSKQCSSVLASKTDFMCILDHSERVQRLLVEDLVAWRRDEVAFSIVV